MVPLSEKLNMLCSSNFKHLQSGILEWVRIFLPHLK
jgi:hypothetical protein